MRKYRKPYRVKRKSSILKNRFFWLGTLILIIFGGIFYLICFAHPFQIKEIKISGNQKVSTENLQNIIQNQIEKKVLFLPAKSIFLVNLNEINKNILEKFPHIAQANLNRDFPDILLVQIEERKPVAILCQNEYCFSVDNSGIAFELNEIQPDLVTLRKGDLNSEIKLGEKLFDQTLIFQILDIQSQLRENFKIPTKEVLIVSDERVNFRTLEGWEIYLNPERDVAWQLTKLRVVLEEEIPPENRKNLEYIDLRFGNFAPYKYRQ